MEKKEDSKLDVAGVVTQLVDINKDMEHINAQAFIDLCISFTKLSSSLGKLVAWGFKGIAHKVIS